jgi:hypothetical protein
MPKSMSEPTVGGSGFNVTRDTEKGPFAQPDHSIALLGNAKNNHTIAANALIVQGAIVKHVSNDYETEWALLHTASDQRETRRINV